MKCILFIGLVQLLIEDCVAEVFFNRKIALLSYIFWALSRNC